MALVLFCWGDLLQHSMRYVIYWYCSTCGNLEMMHFLWVLK